MSQPNGACFQETVCTDGQDNDEDSRIDCEDPDCFGGPFRLTETACDDGEDNDQDSRTDCNDPALLRYDTLRTTDPADFVNVARCLESDGTDKASTELDTPPPAVVWYYLVRS